MTERRSVLIVDDDPSLRSLIASTLRDLGDVDFDEAPNGEQALAAARRRMPAIVFLDHNMPVMNGIEACGELRRLEGGERIKIVMLTGTAPDSEQRARAAGADMFLTKPFSPLELMSLVNDLD